MQTGKIYDLLVIGGGINGTGIAIDAVGRGLSVILCEQNDLASGTSSASTKLIHGGLRYLEQYDFKLVRESLTERQVLMEKAPHLITPLRFIIPYEPKLRPAWMIRVGLWIYDHLGRDSTLERSKKINLHKNTVFGKPLSLNNHIGFAFSDCWVDDARLVITNALGASQLGAGIYTHSQVTSLDVVDGIWHATIYDATNHVSNTVKARAVVNATGPWIKSFIESQPNLTLNHDVRLVRGSHIVVPKQYNGDHAYLIQHSDRRIVFVIPYEDEFTLIGTTEVLTNEPPSQIHIDDEEKKYLIDLFNQHFEKKISFEDIRWEYSGVRPLLEHSGTSDTKLSRDYLLDLDISEGAPVLSVYGGKITTYRTLAEAAVEQLSPYFPEMRIAWTEDVHLPGGDMFPDTLEEYIKSLTDKYSWLPEKMLKRLTRQHGTRIHLVLDGINSLDDMGKHFGADCYEHELRYLLEHEWAKTAEDLLFRRTKLGLHLSPDEIAQIKDWLNKPMPLY